MLGDTCLDTGKMSGSRANWSVCLWISWLEETLPAHPDLRYSMSFTEVNVMTESTFSLGDTICKLKITFTARLREINLWASWKLKATVEAMMLLEAGNGWLHTAYCSTPCLRTSVALAGSHCQALISGLSSLTVNAQGNWLALEDVTPGHQNKTSGVCPKRNSWA